MIDPYFQDKINLDTMYSIVKSPIYVGDYHLGGLAIGFEKKPSWWHRFWMRVCLGWIWKDRH